MFVFEDLGVDLLELRECDGGGDEVGIVMLVAERRGGGGNWE